MEERNWKYKITSRTGLVVAAVMLALFGGVTFWLYTAHNGAFILVGCIAALTGDCLPAVGIQRAVFQGVRG